MRALAGLLLLGGPAAAQQALVIPPPTAAQIQAVAQTVAAAAAVQALPPTCAAVPPSDTLLGTLGSGAPCTPRPDMTRPTVVQATNTVTDATGGWSVTWTRPFVSALPIVIPVPAGPSALPVTCTVFARASGGANGRCWQSVSTTLGGTLTAIAGSVVVPASTVAANTAVMVVAREPTQ